MKKTVLITGGNSGLGYRTAEQLAATGEWDVIIASRSVERTTAAAQQIRESTGQTVLPMQIDLGSLDSVRGFVQTYTGSSASPALDAIICNAGFLPQRLSYSADGIEQTFAVNHLGHFLLVNLLLPHLTESARVIVVSSATHLPEDRLSRLSMVPAPKYRSARALAYPAEASPEDAITRPFQFYSTSKLCNVLFAYELGRRLEGRKIAVLTMDPGVMPDTQLARGLPAPLVKMLVPLYLAARVMIKGIRTTQQSAEHIQWLLTNPAFEGAKGLYFDGDKPVRSSADSYNMDLARDLWETSAELTGLQREATADSA